MGSKKSVTIGYKYYMGIHMGVCRGPIDELVEIQVGDRSAWKGSITENGTFTINNPNLFGGDKSEGGIVGSVEVLMGDWEQPVSGRLAAMLGGIVPAFRRVCTLFFDGQVSAMNPYPKVWKMRVRRALKGWQGEPWYPSKAVINLEGPNGEPIRAMNPAHILYECATNSEWGKGLDRGLIDEASFSQAADTLFDEGFGLCLKWTRTDSVSNFMQTVIDHIGAVVYFHPRTALFTIKLLRADYDPANLPHYTYGKGIISASDVTQGTPYTATNTVTVTYVNPINGEKLSSAPVQNLAAVRLNGSIAQNNEYLGLPTPSLAGRVALRDLEASMGYLRRLELGFDRTGWDILPGDVISITIPEHGIQNMPVRIGSVNSSSHLEGRITFTAVQDVYGLPQRSIVEPQPSEWVPPDQTARPVPIRRVREMGYRDLFRITAPSDLDRLDASTTYLYGMGSKPFGMAYGYELYVDYASSGFADHGEGDWVPNAQIGISIPMAADDIEVPLGGTENLDFAQVGSPAVIDEEEFIVKSINTSTNVVVLGRGTLDTVPAYHAAGSRIWLYDGYTADSDATYLPNTTANVKMLTRTGRELLALSDAPVDVLNMRGRHARPYPPGNFKTNGLALGALEPVARPVTFTWAHRNREAQADQLFGHTYGSLTLPAGVTYTLRILKMSGQVLRSVTGLTGTSWEYTAAMIGEDGIDAEQGQFRVQLWSEVDGLQSWQIYDIPQILIRPGLGLSLGYALGEGD